MIQKHRKTGKVGELPTISENITSTLKNKGTLEKFNVKNLIFSKLFNPFWTNLLST
jgi:hypothetical protein